MTTFLTSKLWKFARQKNLGKWGFIEIKADETFDFQEELKTEFYKAVSSYMGSKFWMEGS